MNTKGSGLNRSDARELVSIVVPCYNETGNLASLLNGLAESLKEECYEVILVDDGSEDDTAVQIETLSMLRENVRGVLLARNFGHQLALTAGILHARGQAVVTMDADMQHPPEVVPEFIRLWREGYAVVQGQRSDTETVPFLKRALSNAYYRFFKSLCGVPLEPGMADFRLIDRTVVDELNAMEEADVFLRGLFAWMGYRRAVVPFQVGERLSGKTKYTARKMLALARAGLLSFATWPLQVGLSLGLGGIAAGLVSLLIALGCVVLSSPAAGTSFALAGLGILVISLLFLMIGIQGVYLRRIFDRTQKRPRFLIQRVVGEE